MKRYILAVLAVALCLCATATASAVDVNMSGIWENGIQFSDNTNFFDSDRDMTSEDDFYAYQRVRFYFEAVAGENLRGVFGLQSEMNYGDATGGATDSSLGADTVGITREETYLEFAWPDTALRLRAGFWYLEPPANFGSPVFNDDAAGISASYAFNDMVSATLFWSRLYDLNVGGETGLAGDGSAADEIDAFGLILPVAGQGWELSPWVIFAAHGNGTAGAVPALAGLSSMNASQIDDDLGIWWAGAQFSLSMFDPFVFYADLVYGAVDGAQERNDRSGWFLDAAVDYKMELVTPRLFFTWGSGEDDDLTDGSERLPTLGGENCGCGLTSFGMDGSAGWLTSSALLIGNGYGFWSLGLSLMDFSLVENLAHTFTIVYGQGTNDADVVKDWGPANFMNYLNNTLGNGYAGFLTDEDSFWEINFDSNYQIYENLTAFLELGYIHVDLDDDVWGNNFGDGEKSATKLAFILQYSF